MERRKKIIEKDLQRQFGGVYAVQAMNDPSGKLRYHITCPEKRCEYKGYNLTRHLYGKVHGWEKNKAKQFVSSRTSMFQHVTLIVRSGQ